MTETCIYCDVVVSTQDRVPALGDDGGWAEVGEEHDDECEWVRTRAHRREGEGDRRAAPRHPPGCSCGDPDCPEWPYREVAQ